LQAILCKFIGVIAVIQTFVIWLL